MVDLRKIKIICFWETMWTGVRTPSSAFPSCLPTRRRARDSVAAVFELASIWLRGTRHEKERKDGYNIPEYTCASFHTISISIKTLKPKMEEFFVGPAHFLLSHFAKQQVKNPENLFLLRGNHKVVACSADWPAVFDTNHPT